MTLSNEQKQIVDLFENLLPWDKEELLIHIFSKYIDNDMYKRICGKLGFDYIYCK